MVNIVSCEICCWCILAHSIYALHNERVKLSLFWSRSLALSTMKDYCNSRDAIADKNELPLDDFSMMIQLTCGGKEPFGRLFPTFTVSLSSS